eukprot:CFRG6541T1
MTSLFSWYWPTSEEELKESEKKLFHSYVNPFKIHQVPIFSGKEFINTITVHPHTENYIDDQIKVQFRDEASRLASKIDSSVVNKDDVAVVIAHGYGCGIGHWSKVFDPLATATGLRVHGIDWLGMGSSSRPQMPKNADDVEEVESIYIESLEEWRKEMNIKKMVLVGHSLGGYLATVYSLKYPEHVHKLVLASPVGIPDRPTEEPERIKNLTGIKRLAYSIVKAGWNSNITAQSVMRTIGPLGPKVATGYVNRRFTKLSAQESEDLSNYFYHISVLPGSGEYTMNTILSFGAYARKPLIHRMHGLKTDTVFLYGSDDWMDKGAAETVSTSMSVPTRLHVVSQSGHNLFADNYKEFNRILINEINGNEPDYRPPTSTANL